MKKTYAKTVFITACISVVVILAVLVFSVMFMFIVSPGRAGDFVYGIGFTDWASTLYYKEYTYSGDIASLYQALNVAIEDDNYDRVVEYYGIFKADANFEDFIEYKITSAKEQNVSPMLKAGLLNEREYLEKNYIKALVNVGKSTDAFVATLANFTEERTYTLTDTGIYTFQYFTDKPLFTEVSLENGETLRTNIIAHLDTLYSIFDANKDATDSLEQAYLIVLGQKIVIVAEHINSLLDSNYADRVATNSAYITSVNTVLQGLMTN